ncbi:MAG: YdeI/OmpD-associated family protein [Pseudomonadota bacterium]
MPVEITETFKAADRADWRAWLAKHHATHSEIWLVSDDRDDVPTVRYTDAVYEALCFGWVDSIGKRINDVEKVQRFSPRCKTSDWTELNKQRARHLIAEGLMTDAGQATLPDLDTPFEAPADILDAIKQNADAWREFQSLPPLYVRVRLGYIHETKRGSDDFDKRLSNFIGKTAAGRLFGNWNDGGRLS